MSKKVKMEDGSEFTPAGAMYFTLLSRVDKESKWHIEFGSYDPAEVYAEREDYREHGHRAGNLKVIMSRDDQESIEAAVEVLSMALQ